MKDQLLKRKNELTKEFDRLNEEREACIQKANENYTQMIKLKGSFEEINKMLEIIKKNGNKT